MRLSRPDTLREALSAGVLSAESQIDDGDTAIPLAAIRDGSCLGGALHDLAGRSVLIAVASQLEAALALIELDGLCRRLVLLPPDVKEEHLPGIIRDAEVDAIVCSVPQQFTDFGVESVRTLSVNVVTCAAVNRKVLTTEWLMLTSGTTGSPKIAVHTFAGLTGAISQHLDQNPRPVWGTFYDIRRFGGLQILLRSVLCCGSLILSRPGEPVADHLVRLRSGGVTHISGTPTHWRKALMSANLSHFHPDYVRLSGEIADQAILDALRATFPEAGIGHAYASTEAGVGFDVNDGREGFPASYLIGARNGVEMRIVDGSLRIRSERMAKQYAGRPDLELFDSEGWIDTGDMVEVRNGRCYFCGRRGGIINVGGLKVHPEEVETVINRHWAVRQSRVKPRKSPVIGSIVAADVVLRENAGDTDLIKRDILDMCRSALPVHKIPAVVNVVAAIEVSSGGKVLRQHA